MNQLRYKLLIEKIAQTPYEQLRDRYLELGKNINALDQASQDEYYLIQDELKEREYRAKQDQSMKREKPLPSEIREQNRKRNRRTIAHLEQLTPKVVDAYQSLIDTGKYRVQKYSRYYQMIHYENSEKN